MLVEGDLGSRYQGVCPSCGAEREFTFRIPEQIEIPSADEVRYGGAEPSELIDPGEWLSVADSAANRAPADPAGLSSQERAQQQHVLAIAIAAVDEVLKFIPEGAETVPESAFGTERGRQVFAAEPGRFSRRRLVAVRAAYREVAARCATA
ncbi:hypothetical protein [Nocardia sp. NPDC049149]|uniref:hypothetical protein n=1 Tax=Nocardia sp. NPDC049149 TaxID=3364315 RepID=UPI00371B2859